MYKLFPEGYKISCGVWLPVVRAHRASGNRERNFAIYRTSYCATEDFTLNT